MQTTNEQPHLLETAAGDDIEAQPMRSNCNTAAASAMIRRKGWAFLKVSGRSMFPWIRENDVVFVRDVRIESMVRGEIAAFEKSGAICVHRVLAVIKSSDTSTISLITKGDATADGDDPVGSAAFVGKVEFVYRGNREIPIASGWRRPFSKLLALISPALGRFKPMLTSVSISDAASKFELSSPLSVHHSAEDSAG